MSAPDMKKLKARSVRAFLRAEQYHTELREIYKYYMPFRQPTTGQAGAGGGGTEGAQRTGELYDGTGLSAAFTFAGNMQADWMPPHQDFFKLEAGPLVAAELRPELQKEFDVITRAVHGVLPRVHVTAHEMFHDLFAGNGAMFMQAGDNKNIIRSRAVPTIELALEEGPWGDIWGVSWKKNYRAEEIPIMWPDGTISDDLAKVIKDDDQSLVEVVQFTYFDVQDDIWRLCVWCDKDKTHEKIWDEIFQISPWITPRLFKVPGEVFGRGLAHLGLPFVKTANKARELSLLAAAFAIMGIWTKRNDSVFNPDTAVFEPMRMWSVSSNGSGILGPSISRLPVPQDFDISSVVIAEEREQIKRVLLDDELPVEQDAVRSATEIAGRLRRYARNKGGTGGRIALELVQPVVENTIRILEQKGALETKLSIDQMLTKVKITAPSAAAQRMQDVERAVQWIEMIMMMSGDQAPQMIAKVEQLQGDIGRWMGVDEQYINDASERQALKDQMQAALERQQEADKPPPTPQQQQAELVNGGAV